MKGVIVMLSPQQRKAAVLMAQGNLKQKEIAEQVDVTQETISRWKNNPEFMREYEQILTQTIKSVAAKAFQTHDKLLSAKSEMVRYLTAKDVLDRSGFKAPDQLSIGINQPIGDTIKTIENYLNEPKGQSDGDDE